MEIPKKKKQRCCYCHKPAIILMECIGCKQTFCIKDRLAEDHKCLYMDQIIKEKLLELPKVIPLKLQKV